MHPIVGRHKIAMSRRRGQRAIHMTTGHPTSPGAQSSKVFCPLPWGSICLQPFGVALCCNSPDDLRETPEQSVADVLDGPRMRRIRSELLRGEWPHECRLCQSKEARGFPTLRQQELVRPEWRDTVRRRNELDEWPEQISYLELAFDKLCNLKCRMCTPRYSSRWSEDLPALARDGLSHMVESGDEVPIAGIEFDELVRRLGPEPRLMLKGGEPLLNKPLLRMLGRLVELGISARTSIKIVTNGTVLPREFMRLIPGFRSVTALVSIDGTGPLHSYIRSGRFGPDDIKRNLDRLQSAAVGLCITTAYQVYNMLDYPRLLMEYRSWTDNFSVSYVTTPWLCAFVAPDGLRNEAAERLQAALPCAPWPAHTRGRLQHIVEDLRHGTFNSDAWQKFLRFTTALDRIRDESLAAAAPELASYVSAPPSARETSRMSSQRGQNR